MEAGSGTKHRQLPLLFSLSEGVIFEPISHAMDACAWSIEEREKKSHDICQGITFHLFRYDINMIYNIYNIYIYVISLPLVLSGAVAPWWMQRWGITRPHILCRRSHFGQFGHGHGVLVLGAVDDLLETHGTHRAAGAGRPLGDLLIVWGGNAILTHTWWWNVFWGMSSWSWNAFKDVLGNLAGFWSLGDGHLEHGVATFLGC